MAFLASESLGFGDRDALQADLLQRFLHLIELERLDDGLDLFHVLSSPGPSVNAATVETALSVSRSHAKRVGTLKSCVFMGLWPTPEIAWRLPRMLSAYELGGLPAK
jgi:hypothetical protein